MGRVLLENSAHKIEGFMLKKDTVKARMARQPKLIFDGPHYTITRIPLNYRIFIKYELKKKIPNNGIDRDCYSDPAKGLEYAKEMAEDIIDTYFVRDKGVYQARINEKLKNDVCHHNQN